MAESYLLRAKRVVGAGLDSVVGAAERLGSNALMRQSIRDVDTAIDAMRRRQEQARNRAARAAAQHRASTDSSETLREQARFALVKGREDLAQATIAEQLAAEQSAALADVARIEASSEIEGVDEAIAQLTARKRRLEDVYRIEQAVSSTQTVSPKLEQRVAKAEEAFERARIARGGIVASESGVGVTALEALQREQAVADRMAELRTSLDPAATPPGKRAGRRGKRG